ncbi:hypothetical protein ACQ3G7_16525 [Kosakonia oryzendophytica]|nr:MULTISPECIES: hypothetical protein [Kosakonia]AMO47537.1 Hypothetical protein AKI40_1117 [Enterobacter sp. FY-07]UXY12001.1 hypothetical protein N7922_05590 [Kosakonia sp. ML.JS2a]WBT59254.1 hypothetical protein O9K67_05540 [Kosakonia oryzendophytica]
MMEVFEKIAVDIKEKISNMVPEGEVDVDFMVVDDDTIRFIVAFSQGLYEQKINKLDIHIKTLS